MSSTSSSSLLGPAKKPQTTQTNAQKARKPIGNPTSKAQSHVLSSIDKVNIDMKQVYKSLTVLGDEIVKKLNELLKDDLPAGIASLKPENHTPEATAQRIVDGTTALLSIYQKQNPNLEGEELLDSFMSTIRPGIKQGYEEAAGILDAMGALGIEGVQGGIETTMQLVEEKLKAFEDNFRKSLATDDSSDNHEIEE